MSSVYNGRIVYKWLQLGVVRCTSGDCTQGGRGPGATQSTSVTPASHIAAALLWDLGHKQKELEYRQGYMMCGW